MEGIKIVPKELVALIPRFEGDKKELNLFILKSEYVIEKFMGNVAQNEYLMHVITSRLLGRALALISERPDVVTWAQLKELFEQHFGDPRSEECIAIELESLKIANGESYLDFCNRIQSVRSALMSKVNIIADHVLKRSKITIYNNSSLNVFLYNLTEDLLRIVRLKVPTTLEEALQFVLEEENFHYQYTTRNKTLKQSATHTTQEKKHFDWSKGHSSQQPFNMAHQNNNFKFGIPKPYFKFGIPQSQQHFNKFPQFGIPQQNFNRFPQPQQNTFNKFNQPLFNKNFTPQQQNFNSFQQQQQNGFNKFNQPQFNKFTVPLQNYNRFQQPNPNFKFGIPNQTLPRPVQDTDVSMRTAPPRPVTQPKIFYNNQTYDNYEDTDTYNVYDAYYNNENNDDHYDHHDQTQQIEQDTNTNHVEDDYDPENENFLVTASTSYHQK